MSSKQATSSTLTLYLCPGKDASGTFTNNWAIILAPADKNACTFYYVTKHKVGNKGSHYYHGGPLSRNKAMADEMPKSDDNFKVWAVGNVKKGDHDTILKVATATLTYCEKQPWSRLFLEGLADMGILDREEMRTYFKECESVITGPEGLEDLLVDPEEEEEEKK